MVSEVHESLWGGVVNGLAVVRTEPGLVALIGFASATMFLFGFEEVVQVLVADDLGMGANGVGVLAAAVGVGGLLVAPFTARLGGGGAGGRFLVLSGVLLGLPMMSLAVIDERGPRLHRARRRRGGRDPRRGALHHPAPAVLPGTLPRHGLRPAGLGHRGHADGRLHRRASARRRPGAQLVARHRGRRRRRRQPAAGTGAQPPRHARRRRPAAAGPDGAAPAPSGDLRRRVAGGAGAHRPRRPTASVAGRDHRVPRGRHPGRPLRRGDRRGRRQHRRARGGEPAARRTTGSARSACCVVSRGPPLSRRPWTARSSPSRARCSSTRWRWPRCCPIPCARR